MKKLSAIIVLVLFSVSTVSAQYYGSVDYRKDKVYNSKAYASRGERGAISKINVFQKEAREKIANGIVNGSLTANEASRLLEMAERIELKENRFMRNGRLTRNEVNEIESDLYKLNKMIVRNKKDNEFAPIDTRGQRNRRY